MKVRRVFRIINRKDSFFKQVIRVFSTAFQQVFSMVFHKACGNKENRQV